MVLYTWVKCYVNCSIVSFSLLYGVLYVERILVLLWSIICNGTVRFSIPLILHGGEMFCFSVFFFFLLLLLSSLLFCFYFTKALKFS